MKPAKQKKKDPAHVVKVGRTKIPIYRLARHGFQFRYYVAGVAKRITRGKLEEAIGAAEHEATGIENGRVQAGDLSAADVQSFVHAGETLGKLGPQAPPLHVALEEYVAARAALPPGSSLLDAARALAKAQPAGMNAATLAQTLDQFLLSVADQARNPRYLRGLRCDLGRFVAWLPEGQRLPDVSALDIQAYLRALAGGTLTDTWRGRTPQTAWKAVGPRRRDNIRDSLVALFRFGKEHGHLPEDRTTEAEKVRRLDAVHQVRYYTPEQITGFLVHVRQEWLPWLVLGAFAGMRSSEIVGDPEDPDRPRLRWSDFRWEKGHIVVPALTARKIKRARRVPLRDNLKAWLLPWRNATGFLYEPGADQSLETERLGKLKDARGRSLGLEWDNNALRHSYGTHRNAEIGNAGQLAEEMGTSIAMIRRHYDAVPADIEPTEYFGIAPGPGAKIIPMVEQNR